MWNVWVEYFFIVWFYFYYVVFFYDCNNYVWGYIEGLILGFLRNRIGKVGKEVVGFFYLYR